MLNPQAKDINKDTLSVFFWRRIAVLMALIVVAFIYVILSYNNTLNGYKKLADEQTHKIFVLDLANDKLTAIIKEERFKRIALQGYNGEPEFNDNQTKLYNMLTDKDIDE